MTEAEARAHQGVGGLEVWLSLQPWQPALDGWTIARDLEGWRFRLMQASGGFRVNVITPCGGTLSV